MRESGRQFAWQIPGLFYAGLKCGYCTGTGRESSSLHNGEIDFSAPAAGVADGIEGADPEAIAPFGQRGGGGKGVGGEILLPDYLALPGSDAVHPQVVTGRPVDDVPRKGRGGVGNGAAGTDLSGRGGGRDGDIERRAPAACLIGVVVGSYRGDVRARRQAGCRRDGSAG